MDPKSLNLSTPNGQARSTVGYGQRLLFVDDDPELRSAVARMLNSRGFLVDVAAGAQEALELAQAYGYSVIATDLCMPEEDGLWLIDRVLQQAPDTVIVVVTGQSSVDIPTDPGYRHNIVSVVTKPYDCEMLVDTLHRAFRSANSSGRTSSPTRASKDPRAGLLLVEDSDSDAALVEAYLQDAPDCEQITRVTRLDKALETLEQAEFGFIIVDLALPDARGLDAVLRIQNIVPETPLIVVSGLQDEILEAQTLQAGAQEYLFKDRLDRAAILRSIRHAKERKRAEQALSQLAHFDSLTGLANRAMLRQRLEHRLRRARRTSDPFAVMFIDLDGFKPVNDVCGHAAGDLLLIEVSRRLESAVREYDTVARLGGDEFAVILDHLPDPIEATHVADRMLLAIARPCEVHGRATQVTSSIGIAFHPDAGTTIEELLKAADKAMYTAKRRGGNTYEAYISPLAGRNSPALALRAALQHALAQGEFHLYYQPLYDVQQQFVVAAEGLLRWNRQGGRILPPAEFLPFLEESREIVIVGAWAIAAACQEFQLWRSQGLNISRVSVNVSVRQLEYDQLIHTVDQALAQASIDPACLELEVTESSLMTDPERAKRTLNQLKEWGIRIAMDDFGTGYSSLSYLHRLPIDTVKIDQSFVRELSHNRECRAVIRAIIALAKELDLTIVAEGVETIQQRSFLEDQGCNVLQGYLFGRPMPAMQLTGHLAALTTSAGTANLTEKR